MKIYSGLFIMKEMFIQAPWFMKIFKTIKTCMKNVFKIVYHVTTIFRRKFQAYLDASVKIFDFLIDE